jgi:hypothetical protein
VCCVAAALVFQIVRQPGAAPPEDGGRAVATPHAKRGPDPASDGRPAAGAALLAQLTTRLEHGTPEQVARLGASARARDELTTLRRNVHALRVIDLSMRYLGADAARSAASEPKGGAGEAPGPRWSAVVQVGWRLRGFDPRPARLTVAMTFAEDGTGGGAPVRARFVTARRVEAGRRGAVPVWLLGPVSTARTDRSLVITGHGRPTGRYSRLADHAVADVHRVLPRWSGRLVVEVPGRPADLARVLGSAPSDYAQIAAVTTTEDGSTRAAAPVHIFVNPRVLDPLGPRGAQIVMSHEATHVATGAAVSSMPPWLLEGFADYVALNRVQLPVQVTASQVLAQVRAHGAPSRLPGRAGFGAHRRGLGAAYESAWLACRLLSETYGERRLVQLYRVVDHGTSTSRAFREVLGTDERAFTDRWRHELRRLAG